MPGLLGISIGASGGGQSSSSSSTGNTQNTYTAGQTGLMQLLGNYFQSLVPSQQAGTLSPDVQAQETGSANTINKNYSSLGSRMQKFLATRGYGKSGVAGASQLQTELARQGDLAGNQANFAGIQLGQNQTQLLAALNYAFNPIGKTTADTSQSSGTEWGVGAGVGGSVNV